MRGQGEEKRHLYFWKTLPLLAMETRLASWRDVCVVVNMHGLDMVFQKMMTVQLL